MMSKPPFPPFSQFVIALQGYDMRYGSVTNSLMNLNSNLLIFGQRNGRNHGSNQGRNQGLSFNFRRRGFALANHNSTQYERGSTIETNQ
jgi:hypothetical protein